MSRLHTIKPDQATGRAAELFTAIKSSIGMVPNAYATIGSNSPAALEAFLGLDQALRKSSLSAKLIEVVKLAVSAAAECDYCLAAHSLMGKRAGLGIEAIKAIRSGSPSGDAAVDALAGFARKVAGSAGTVPAAVLEEVRAAGYSDAQVVDTLLTVAAITFTNLLNRVNDTVVDFPAVN